MCSPMLHLDTGHFIDEKLSVHKCGAVEVDEGGTRENLNIQTKFSRT